MNKKTAKQLKSMTTTLASPQIFFFLVYWVWGRFKELLASDYSKKKMLISFTDVSFIHWVANVMILNKLMRDSQIDETYHALWCSHIYKVLRKVMISMWMCLRGHTSVHLIPVVLPINVKCSISSSVFNFVDLQENLYKPTVLFSSWFMWWIVGLYITPTSFSHSVL